MSEFIVNTAPHLIEVEWDEETRTMRRGDKSATWREGETLEEFCARAEPILDCSLEVTTTHAVEAV